MLRTRLATAAVALPLLVWLILAAPAWLYDSFILFFTFVSLREMAAMARIPVRGATTLITAAGMTVAVSMLIDHSGAAVSAGIVIALIITLLGTLASAKDMGQSVRGAAEILMASLYGGVFLPHLIWLRELDRGALLVFFVIACSMGSDVGGYFVGRSFGSRKLWPTVSPKKTIEGAAGAVGAAVMVGVVVGHLLFGLLGVGEALVVAAVISVLAQVGDLLESMIKRAHDAKDSGWLVPGHGGVLDRTDSIILPVVFVYYYAVLLLGA